MRKKVLSVLLSMVMVTGLVVGCSNSNDKKYDELAKKIEQLENGTIIKLWDTNREYEEFLDWDFNLNYEKLEICYGYLSKKIYAAPALTNFIQNKFMTEDEIAQKNNFRIALAGVLIAIVTSLLSMISNIIF